MIALPLLRDGRAAETELPLLGGPPTSAQVQRCTLGASRKGGRRVCVRFLKRLRWCKSLMDKSFKTSGFLSRILKAGLVTSPGGGGYTEPKPTHCPQHPTHRPGPGRPRVGPQMQGSSRAGLRLPPAGPGLKATSLHPCRLGSSRCRPWRVPACPREHRRLSRTWWPPLNVRSSSRLCCRS